MFYDHLNVVTKDSVCCVVLLELIQCFIFHIIITQLLNSFQETSKKMIRKLQTCEIKHCQILPLFYLLRKRPSVVSER